MTAKQAAVAQRAFSLRLYKAILRSHKLMLPPVMRDIGDVYVREEFKRHKDAKPEHLHAFFREWLRYLEMMKTQGERGFGADMNDELFTAMNAEQKQQLEQLKKEALKVGELAQRAAIDSTTQLLSDADSVPLSQSVAPMPMQAIDENDSGSNAPPFPASSTVRG